jgi:hypothetical protein
VHTGECSGGGDTAGLELADPSLFALAVGDDADGLFESLLKDAVVGDKANVSACRDKYVAWACAQRLPKCNENLNGPLAVCQDTCKALFEWCVDNGVLSRSNRQDLKFFGNLDPVVCEALPTTDCTAASLRVRPSLGLVVGLAAGMLLAVPR